MKNFLFGVFGVLLSIVGANAEVIKTATTNTVNKKVYNINYGNATANTRGYRGGVIPQTNELDAAEGNTGSDINDVDVGYLAAAATAAPDDLVGFSGAPTETITANTANIEVLKRDKLVAPGDGNCTTGSPCGYVTIGNHGNTDTEHVWIKIVE